MSRAKIFLFTTGYWLVAASLLLLDSLPNVQKHPDIAMIRFGYFFFMAMLLSYAMAGLYQAVFFVRQKFKVAIMFLFSALAAFLTSLLVNPVTFLLAGTDISKMPGRVLTSDLVMFGALYLIWSFLFLQLARPTRNLGGGNVAGQETQIFKVVKNGEQRSLQAQDIILVTARGDYVELTSKKDVYLIKDSVSNLEKVLDKNLFKRVHRSMIINQTSVVRVKAKTGGIFEITLKGGQRITSSRSYKTVVQSILPGG